MGRLVKRGLGMAVGTLLGAAVLVPAAAAGKAVPTLTTYAQPLTIVNGPLNDTAKITAGLNPTGTVTFQLFGPNDPTCAGAPIGGSQKAVNGNGDYTSDPAFVTQTGTHRWVVTYSGDALNEAVTSPCGVEQAEVYPDTASVAGRPGLPSEAGEAAVGRPPNCRGQAPTIVGSPGHDEIVGTRGPDVIVGLGGHDDIIGRRGDDVICGNGGNDRIFGNRGADVLAGGSGNDTLFGGPGNDRLSGGSGINNLHFGPGG